MSAKSEYDAAYFTLLRALEERDEVLRYRDFLEREVERLESFATETRELVEALPRRVRRPVDLTTRATVEVVGRRRAVVLEELRRVPDRLTNAERFVAECEADLAALRG
jgi:hypothetical protein